MEGWIKLHRKFLNWEWSDVPGMVSLFVHLLLEANHEDHKYHGEIVRRGQVLCSRSKLCQLTGLSERSLRTCLTRLEQTGEIVRKSTNKNSIITICNYDRYQVYEEDERPATDQQPTSNRPATDQPSNKNDKNIINNNPQNARTCAREDWRNLSSMRKASLGFDKNRIAEYKREVFRQQVAAVAPEYGMTPQQQEAFVRYWTEHNPGNDMIKAEYEPTFDVRSRIQGWMSRESRRPPEQPQKTRMDKYEEDMKYINDFFNGQQQRNTTVDEQ